MYIVYPYTPSSMIFQMTLSKKITEIVLLTHPQQIVLTTKPKLSSWKSQMRLIFKKFWSAKWRGATCKLANKSENLILGSWQRYSILSTRDIQRVLTCSKKFKLCRGLDWGMLSMRSNKESNPTTHALCVSAQPSFAFYVSTCLRHKAKYKIKYTVNAKPNTSQ